MEKQPIRDYLKVENHWALKSRAWGGDENHEKKCFFKEKIKNLDRAIFLFKHFQKQDSL